MGTTERVAEAANAIGAAIARRDVAALRRLLAPGFIQRTHGGAVSDVETFLRAIEQIPGEIRSVSLEQLEVDMCPAGALVTGIQYAQVVVDGQLIEDRRRFIDWFVEDDGLWRIQAAVDLPASG
jgi:hypothetical protein